MAIYLAVITAYDIGGAAVTTLYYGTKGFTTGPADSPANTWFAPRIKRAPSMVRSAFRQGTTGGKTQQDFGTLVLSNEDGSLDGLIDYAFDGRAITVYRGEETGTFPTDFEEVVTATMEQALVDADEIQIPLRGRHFEVDVPLQSTLYAGTGDLGGDESLKGKPKPLLYGEVRNISPPLVNAAKLIFQLNDGALASVDDVYDQGLSLGKSLTAWTARTNPGTKDLRVARYADGIFLAAGNDGLLLTSTDATTWTSRTTGFGTDDIKDAAYSESLDLWVIVGQGNRIETSPDGITWTSRTSPFTAGATIMGVAWGSGPAVFVAIASNGEVASSANGTSWTLRTTPFTIVTANNVGLRFGRNLFVAAMGDLTTHEVATTVDGVTWTLRESVITQTKAIHDIEYGRGTFVMVGTDFATSPDGISWTRRPDVLGPGTPRMWRVTYGGPLNRFVGVGILDDSGTPLHRVFYSSDGIVWEAIDPGLAGQVDGFFQGAGVAHSDTTTVAVGEADVLGSGEPRIFTVDAAGSYASQADLLDDDLQPTPGTYKAYLAGGLIRLGSPPAGQVTADATQGAAASDRTAGQLFTDVLVQVGLTSADWNATDITDLDTDDNAVLGYWSGVEVVQASAVLDALARTVGAWWGVDRTGDFRVQQLQDPSSGSSVLTIDEAGPNAIFLRTFRRLKDELPTYRQIIRFSRNYTVQSSDLAAGVSDTRRALLAQPWKEESDEDTGVLTKHLLAREDVAETLYAEAADADAEATRRLALRKVIRDLFQFEVPMNGNTVALDLGSIVTVEHSRFGLSAGKKHVVLGVEPNTAQERLRLTVWS